MSMYKKYPYKVSNPSPTPTTENRSSYTKVNNIKKQVLSFRIKNVYSNSIAYLYTPGQVTAIESFVLEN